MYKTIKGISRASLPVRGAWIEISAKSASVADHSQSLPVRGAWIEILMVSNVQLLMISRRSPCGERGLKCIDDRATAPEIPVAPRAGSVD